MADDDDEEDDFRELFAATGPALRRAAYLIVRDWHLCRGPNPAIPEKGVLAVETGSSQMRV